MSNHTSQVLSVENRDSFLAEDDACKEKPQFVLTAKGELVRHTDAKATKTSLVLEIPRLPHFDTSALSFALGECHIQISYCKKFLALYFLEAELVWMLDFNKQILYKFDWKANNLVKVERCSISFQENATTEWELVPSVNAAAEKKATTQALFCSTQGHHKRAMDLHALEEAIRIYKKNHGTSHPEVARALLDLGNLHDDAGSYNDAMESFFEALDIYQNLFGNDSLQVAEVFYCMGHTLQNWDSMDHALDCFEESLDIHKPQLGLDAMENIGNVHLEKKEYGLAIECFEECLGCLRIELGNIHGKVADALIAMGDAQTAVELGDEALRSYREALAIRLYLFGENDSSVGAALERMGPVEFRNGEYEKALSMLVEAIRIRQNNDAEEDVGYSNVLFMIGNIHKMQGNDEEAMDWWTDAYDAFRELGLEEGNPQVVQVMEDLLQQENREERRHNERFSCLKAFQKMLKNLAKKFWRKRKVSPVAEG
ncbi:Kinesin light chain [Seminavis robusta]|uniref:Kinesin light chain n=1 Tax=Seminavis robusta TaxID=568900 RepID=A0A9N8EKV2_9STRA|nr:Kinesin light chain [Seminavis robusta]|eukprot:Sro1130_g244540.1 Kinesin light chain (485) ;mRNA; r:27556-29561